MSEKNVSLQNCLFPLLNALGWKGDRKGMRWYLGSSSRIENVEDFRNIMASLRFGSKADSVHLSAVDERVFPMLYIDENENSYCVLRRVDTGHFVYDGAQNKFRILQNDKLSKNGTSVVFRPFENSEDSILISRSDWLRLILFRFKSYFTSSLFISMILGVLSVLYPVVIMTVYSQMAIKDNGSALRSLAFGALLFIAAEAGFRFLRSSLLSYTAMRSGKILGEEIFRRLLSFQSSFTEDVSTEAQLRRMRDLNNISDFIAGSAFSALLDFPFVIIMVIWLASLNGVMALVPTTALILFIVLSLIAYPLMKRVQSVSASARSERMDTASVILEHAEDILSAGMGNVWTQKFDNISAKSALLSYKEASSDAFLSALTSFLVSVSGLAALYVGVRGVFAETIQPSSLIASMMLVWRILGSARSLTSVLPQINSLSSSVKQLQKFMTLPQEIQPTAFTVPQRQPEGDFEFKDVSFRYGQEGYPALYMVSFTAQAGKITVLAGHQGSGKSTAVKLALALYRPQAGRVLWGPYTIQQLDPTFLRSSISYAPERPAVVCGSVREYLLSSRTADDESVIQTAERTGLTAELAAHGKTFDSQISECLSISSDIDRLLSITRAFSAKTSLYIIDEQIFMDRDTYRPILISEIKRAAAAGAVVIAVSNDAEMQRQSDRVIRFDSGKVITIENRRIK